MGFGRIQVAGMNLRRILLGAILVVPVLSHAANIDRSTLTEVVNSVQIIEPATKKSSAAKVQAEFFAPNVLRTGSNSRAEMIAPDQTVTRVGQNTVFSFSRESREIELQKGSILFQSPSGKGGGTIRTSAASAAVLGTTMIVCATKNGGFKVLLVEGTGRVKSGDGSVRKLNGGEMVYALPGGKLSGIFEFRLSQQVAASNLVGGFKKKLPSAGKIQAAINKQEKDLASGKAMDTGLLASGSPSIAYRVDVARDSLTDEASTALVGEQSSRFLNAATTAVTNTASALDSARIFATGDLDAIGFPGDSRPFVEGDEEGLLPRRSDNSAQFIASSITFDSASISLDPFAGREVFRFLSLGDIALNQSVDFGQFEGALQLWAGGTFTKQEGEAVALRAAAVNLTLAAFGVGFSTDEALPQTLASISPTATIRLGGFTAENTRGNLTIVSGNVELAGTRLGAGEIVSIGATQDFVLRGAQNTAQPLPLTTDPSSLQSANASIIRAGRALNVKTGRDVSIRNTGIFAPRVRIDSGRDLILNVVQIDDGTLAGQVSPAINQAGAPVHLSTRGVANLNSVSFLSNDVILSARTVNLRNVLFRGGSRVILESANGQLAPNPNTNAPSLPGFVNFIQNVRYGQSPADTAIISNGPGQGIIIRPRGGGTPP